LAIGEVECNCVAVAQGLRRRSLYLKGKMLCTEGLKFMLEHLAECLGQDGTSFVLDVASKRLEHDHCVQVNITMVVLAYHPYMISSVYIETVKLGKSEEPAANCICILVYKWDSESCHGV
jgi:hypothetical protein